MTGQVRGLVRRLGVLTGVGDVPGLNAAITIVCGNLVMSCVEQGTHGIMATFRDGLYLTTDMPTSQVESRRVEPHDYRAERYSPQFECIHGDYISYVPTHAAK